MRNRVSLKGLHIRTWNITPKWKDMRNSRDIDKLAASHADLFTESKVFMRASITKGYKNLKHGATDHGTTA